MTAAMMTGVTVGVDTHADIHVGVALDRVGRRLGLLEIATTPSGYRKLLSWAQQQGEVSAFGIEGTGSYGAGLTRFLSAAGYPVLEVNRPNRQTRRANGKSDPADAEAAARAVLAGTATAVPKADQEAVGMIKCLRVERRSAVKMRTQTINQMKALLVTAPEPLRSDLRGLTVTELVASAAAFRPGDITTIAAATKFALRGLARRYQQLDTEISALDLQLARLTAMAAPALMAVNGVGPDVAGALLVAVGDNPERLRSEASFASLCGASPVKASSGKTQRHRLNRGGDRLANNALWRIVMVRIAHHHESTERYMDRRVKQGLSKLEVIRCLKRFVAREVYRALLPPGAALA